jgi:hypothetical protein
MAGNPGFQAEGATILQHAGTVDDVADLVDQGRAAAGAVRVGRDAYGVLCGLFPTLLDPVQESIVGALHEASDSLRATAEDLRSTAHGYTDTDERAERIVRAGPTP